MKLNRIKLTALSLLLTIGLAMCSDNNDNPTPEFPNGQWSKQ